MSNTLVSRSQIQCFGKPILMLAGCTLSIMAAFLALLSGTPVEWSGAIAVAFPVLVLLFAGIRKSIQVAESLDVFSPLIAFPVCYTLWFLSGTVSLMDGAEKVGLYSTVGLMCYLLGTALIRRRRTWRPLRADVCTDDWNRGALLRVISGLSILALASYVYIVSRMGIPALSADAGEVRLKLGDYGPALQVLLTSSYSVLLFLAVFLWKNRESRTIRVSCYALMCLLSMALLSLGSRGYLTVPFVTAVVARQYLRKPFKVAALVLLAAGLFVSLSFYGYTRDTLLAAGTLDVAGSDTIAGKIFPFIYLYLYVVQPVDALQQVTDVIPRKIPYQHGDLTFGALKTLLPGHHEMSDMFFKKMLGSDFIGGGQPATLLGPFYGDYGLTGIVLGTFVVGLLLTKLYLWMREGATLFRILVYAWAMQTALFSLFGAIFPYITTLWLPLFWWLLHTTILRCSPVIQNPGVIKGALLQAEPS